MKYIFFGTPEFAATILEKLIDAHMPPLALVCNPDKPSGRKMIITPPPTKQRIMNYELGIRERIEILQPEKINEEFLNKLRSYGADFFIVAAYSKILPSALLAIPRLGVIGIHPSLLPKLRGSSPIQSAILEGNAKTGVTLYLLDEKVDHGLVISHAVYDMPTPHTYIELNNILAKLAGNLLIETLPNFRDNKITPERQNETEATFTKKFSAEDGYIELEKLKIAMIGGNLELANVFDRTIKALNPEPGVYTFINGKRTKLLSSTLENGRLVLKEIQFEGKKPMSFSQYRNPSLI